MSEQSNATKNETGRYMLDRMIPSTSFSLVNIIENDIYMKLHYKTDGTKNSIFSDVVTLQQVAENVFYQNGMSVFKKSHKKVVSMSSSKTL